MALQVGVERFPKYWFGLAYNKVSDMGSLRMLLHPSHINPTKSDTAIAATVSTLTLSYLESSKSSDILYLLGTT